MEICHEDEHNIFWKYQNFYFSIMFFKLFLLVLIEVWSSAFFKLICLLVFVDDIILGQTRRVSNLFLKKLSGNMNQIWKRVNLITVKMWKNCGNFSTAVFNVQSRFGKWNVFALVKQNSYTYTVHYVTDTFLAEHNSAVGELWNILKKPEN